MFCFSRIAQILILYNDYIDQPITICEGISMGRFKVNVKSLWNVNHLWMFYELPFDNT